MGFIIDLFMFILYLFIGATPLALGALPFFLLIDMQQSIRTTNRIFSMSKESRRAEKRKTGAVIGRPFFLALQQRVERVHGALFLRRQFRLDAPRLF